MIEDKNDQEEIARVSAQVEQYQRLLPRYQALADVLRSILEQAALRYAPSAIIQTRPKTIVSFAEKIQRRRPGYLDPINQFTDLCGGRVITQTPDEVHALCGFIEKSFAIDWENSIDVSQRLKPTEFGYRSVHYIISVKPGVFPQPDIDTVIPENIYGLKAEIQVRTILEHAWADFNHRLIYKSPFPVPARWTRELAGLAALLERADGAFAVIESGLRTYQASYGAYLSAKEINDEIALLEGILPYDSRNLALAHRIGKLAMAAGDWPKAAAIFSRYVETGYQPILRDLGITLCKLHRDTPTGAEYRQGQHYLELATASPSRDADALASLAGTWRSLDDARAQDLYRRAFEADPAEPYPLGRYLEYQATQAQGAAAFPMLKQVLEAAIQRCRDRAEVGMDLPWPYYDMGKFYLFLAKPYESLTAYTKAVQLTNHPWMLLTALTSLDVLSTAQQQLPGLAWAQRFLQIAQAARFADDAQRVASLRPLAASGQPAFGGPVVIIAGACDANLEAQMQSYQPIMLQAFRDFRGTVISGGTRAGVAGLAGDVQQAYPTPIYAVGYVPRQLSADVTLDPRYGELRVTDGTDFSPLEPLQYWTDILAAGIRPAHVKLIAINGGKIAAIEYRIALALGASVAVLVQSGRAADGLAADKEWAIPGKLVHLPVDGEILGAFVRSEAAAAPWPTATTHEQAAAALHQENCEVETALWRAADPALATWSALTDEQRDIVRLQADLIFVKLASIGYTVQPSVHGATLNLEGPSFTESEATTLAQVEHAQWVVQHLQDGWAVGERRDPIQKVSPYLVSWNELPPWVQEEKREKERRLPALLARLGLQLNRIR